MKIVFVIPDMPGGGTERVVALLANEYCKRGLETAVLLFAGHETKYPLDERVEVVIAGDPSGGRLGVRIDRLRRMRQYYKKNKGCQIWAFSVMGALFSVIAAWGQKHFFLVSERNDPDRYDHKKIRNLAYRFADVVVCQTNDAVRAFPAGIARKAVVIPNPVEIRGIKPYEGVREPRIVAVGRLEQQKNHELLLHAFAEFGKSHQEYRLEIYGRGEREKALRKTADMLGITDRVIFRGFSDRVMEEINTAAMYVLSSDYEGISNSMLEAMALGIPVIATDCPAGGSRMYIKDGRNGLLVPVGEVNPMVEAMCRVADDSEFAASIGAAASKLREQNGTGQIADRFLQAADGTELHSGRY
ncbi:MAG: glycosyltransferase family 4 protein [Lachnospiraceae bacterium]|nr:glycosyltransferase family 4 protein [Lachnospiraceae bacterium]